MCLGIPGRVLEISGEDTLLTGRVDFGGVTRDVCLSYVPDVQVGEYVIVHVGFAISKLDEDEAQKTLEILTAMGDLVQAELAGDAQLPGEPAAAAAAATLPGEAPAAAAATLPGDTP